ncbi:MAG: hypothetical protein M0Z30_16080, partial [Actinomycetota bacterium]|nr:hypothetical protein [Actinomycetota bacterium]
AGVGWPAATVLLSQGDPGRQQQPAPGSRAGDPTGLTDADPEPAGPARPITSRSSSIDLRL